MYRHVDRSIDRSYEVSILRKKQFPSIVNCGYSMIMTFLILVIYSYSDTP